MCLRKINLWSVCIWHPKLFNNFSGVTTSVVVTPRNTRKYSEKFLRVVVIYITIPSKNSHIDHLTGTFTTNHDNFPENPRLDSRVPAYMGSNSGTIHRHRASVRLSLTGEVNFRVDMARRRSLFLSASLSFTRARVQHRLLRFSRSLALTKI